MLARGHPIPISWEDWVQRTKAIEKITYGPGTEGDYALQADAKKACVKWVDEQKRIQLRGYTPQGIAS